MRVPRLPTSFALATRLFACAVALCAAPAAAHADGLELLGRSSGQPGAKAQVRHLVEAGRASFYGHGDGFAGRRTASGEKMDPAALTAAHKTLPLGSRVVVERVDTGATVQVRINDRGPYAKGRVIDVSYAAALRLGMVDDGHVKVRLYRVR